MHKKWIMALNPALDDAVPEMADKSTEQHQVPGFDRPSMHLARSEEDMHMKDVDLQLTRDELDHVLNEGTCHVFRSTPLGRTWDTFRVNGRRYEIIDVSERSMGTIAHMYYRLENCNSPEDFIHNWKARHSGSWEPERMLYIHWFRDITGNPGNDLI
jgi:hypothetical protein